MIAREAESLTVACQGEPKKRGLQMVVRLFLAAAALAAVTVGFLLPLPGRGERHDTRVQAAGREAGRS
jgi:hypothetical protein